MNNRNLYLVGTVHYDLDGRERLDTLLDRLSPSVVALEFNKDREDLGALRKSPEEEQREINAMIDESGLNLNQKQRATLIESGHRIKDVMGYEFKSSVDYTRRNLASRLEYIDISIFANGKEEFIKDYVEAMKGAFKQIAGEPELVKPLLERLDGGIDVYLKHVRGDVQQIYQNVEAMAELFEMIRDPETFEMMKGVMPPQAVQALEQIYNPRRDGAMAGRVRELYDGNSGLVAVVGLGHLTGLKTKLKDLRPKAITLAESDNYF